VTGRVSDNTPSGHGKGAVDRVLGEDLAEYAYTARSQSELFDCLRDSRVQYQIGTYRPSGSTGSSGIAATRPQEEC
jgi:hypothetical protein